MCMQRVLQPSERTPVVHAGACAKHEANSKFTAETMVAYTASELLYS